MRLINGLFRVRALGADGSLNVVVSSDGTIFRIEQSINTDWSTINAGVSGYYPNQIVRFSIGESYETAPAATAELVCMLY